MALAADTTVLTRGNFHSVRVPVVASDIIYKGALVSIDTAGRAIPAADTASTRFAGICEKQADNASGAAEDINVQISVAAGAAQMLLTVTSGVQTDVGEVAYVTDDESVGNPGTDPGNTVVVGRAVQFVSSTQEWIMLQGFGVNA